MSEPTFSAANIKLDLPPKFTGKPSELSGWLFEAEQYCDIVGIVKPVDRVSVRYNLVHLWFFADNF